jgi:hypothetical protein
MSAIAAADAVVPKSFKQVPIDWNKVAEYVNLDRQSEALHDLIAMLSGKSEINALANALGIYEWKVVVAVAATRWGGCNRAAQCVATKRLGAGHRALLSAAEVCVPA